MRVRVSFEVVVVVLCYMALPSGKAVARR